MFKRKAQAGIITTILLILLVLALIIIVWNVVNRVVKTGAEGIGTEALTVNLEISEVKLGGAVGAKIRVKRGAGEGDITSLKFIFYDEDGESHIVEKTDNLPDELETKIYDFSVGEINSNKGIKKVSVVPMFGPKAKTAGMESSEVLDIQKSCLDILNHGKSTGNGVYWIDPDGDEKDLLQVNCDMTTDGGGWTLVARMTNGCYTYTRSAVGILTSPSQAACAKLSDADINAIRTSPGTQGVFWGWHDATPPNPFPLPPTGRFVKIISGEFNADSYDPSLTQQCSCVSSGPWSSAYSAANNMAGVYTHDPSAWKCVTVGADGCTSATVYPSGLFLYQHILHIAGTFPSDPHGVPGGSNGYLYLR